LQFDEEAAADSTATDLDGEPFSYGFFAFENKAVRTGVENEVCEPAADDAAVYEEADAADLISAVLLESHPTAEGSLLLSSDWIDACPGADVLYGMDNDNANFSERERLHHMYQCKYAESGQSAESDQTADPRSTALMWKLRIRPRWPPARWQAYCFHQ
jgi:hypothetical protein